MTFLRTLVGVETGRVLSSRDRRQRPRRPTVGAIVERLETRTLLSATHLGAGSATAIPISRVAQVSVMTANQIEAPAVFAGSLDPIAVHGQAGLDAPALGAGTVARDKIEVNGQAGLDRPAFAAW